MRISGRRYEIDWGHTAVVLCIADVIAAYWLDARSVSLGINNLLLVQPASLLGLVLCAIVLRQCVRQVPDECAAEPATPSVRWTQAIELLKVAAMAAALGVFVFSLETIGFDAACFLFVAVGLVICGERRWWVLILFPAVFTVLLILFFRALIPFPMPTLLL